MLNYMSFIVVKAMPNEVCRHYAIRCATACITKSFIQLYSLELVMQ